VDVKVNSGGTGFSISDGSGRQITQFSITPSAAPGTPITGTAAGSNLALSNVVFADAPFGTENLLTHFKDFTVNLTTPADVKLTKTITMAAVLAADLATATPKLQGANFKPNDPTVGPGQLAALAGYMQTLVNVNTGWTNTANGATVDRPADDLTLTWKADTSSFNIATGATSGTYVSGMSLGLNTADVTFGKNLTKGSAVKAVAPTLDSAGAVLSAGSYTLSNVSFPMSTKAVGDEFESFKLRMTPVNNLTRNHVFEYCHNQLSEVFNERKNTNKDNMN
jgi:hypothetical protein